MKPIVHIYSDNEIEFFISNDRDVLANATQMAFVINKKPEVFLKLKETEKFIEVLLRQLNSTDDPKVYSEQDLLIWREDNLYMHRKIAIRFANWIGYEFGIWFFEIVDEILYGNYKKHWNAHVTEKSSQAKMAELKKKLVTSANQEDVIAYFKAEREFINAKMTKVRSIKTQYSFEFDFI